MSTTEEKKDEIDIWGGEDKESFESLSHPGYTIESDPETHTGGWLAHRAALEPVDGVAPSCWVRDEVGELITRYEDYSKMPIGRPPRILVLYGSLRPSSFSRKLAYEFARLLDELVRPNNATLCGWARICD